MSRRIVIAGSVIVEVADIAEEVVAEMRRGGGATVKYDAQHKRFVYDGLDDHYREGAIEQAQARYGEKLRDLRARQVMENAKKSGYVVEQRKVGDKVKIVAKMRVYV